MCFLVKKTYIFCTDKDTKLNTYDMSIGQAYLFYCLRKKDDCVSTSGFMF